LLPFRPQRLAGNGRLRFNDAVFFIKLDFSRAWGLA
jgi:hypothetical protein